MERVRTARLAGTRPVPGDAEDLHAVMADPRVAAWLWPGHLAGPRTLDEVRSLVAEDIAHWKRDGWGPWTVRDARSGAVFGRVGIARVRVDGRDEVEATWAIGAEHWGRGLASEMAGAAVRAAFEHVGLDDLVAFTLPTNTASRRVMERLGFAYERDVRHADLPHVLYRLRRPRG